MNKKMMAFKQAKRLMVLPVIFGLTLVVSFAVLGLGTAGFLKATRASEVEIQLTVPEPLEPALRLSRTVKVISSAYSSTVDQTDSTPCHTANGFNVCQHYSNTQTIDTVATNGLPMGTVVRFPNVYPHLKFVVRDRMNARYNSRFVDIWLPTRSDAVAFGRRVVDMEIYEPVE